MSTDEFVAAREQYKRATKEYLASRGEGRKIMRQRLYAARERSYDLELKLIEKKISLLEDRLEALPAGSSGRTTSSNELLQLRSRRQKLLSRLSHEDWLEYTRSVWRFKEMESNVKTGKHPAQFSAEIPRRAIKMYSFVGETVLDPFVGTGTTLLEARSLHRHSIGVDVSPEYIRIAKARLSQSALDVETSEYEPVLRVGDARNLSFIEDESIHLVIAHPPYWNAVRTSNQPNDLSNISSYQDFLDEMEKVLKEIRRVLQKDRVFLIFTGDVRKKIQGVTRIAPLHADYIKMGENMGFHLWDVFIVETKIRQSGGKPTMGSYPFPTKLFAEFAHNYCLVFRKT